MMSDWNLSDKVCFTSSDKKPIPTLDYYKGKDVREFIKRLKINYKLCIETAPKTKEMKDAVYAVTKIIEAMEYQLDKLAGSKLIGVGASLNGNQESGDS